MSDDTSQEEMLRDSVADVLRAECPLDAVLRFVTRGDDLDQRLWRTATELGWLGVAAPEGVGGSGLGRAEILAIYGELGRSLAPLPFLQTQLAIETLSVLEGARNRQLERLVSGEARGAVSLDRIEPIACRRQGAAFLLSGARLMVDALRADHLVLFVQEEGGDLAALLTEPGDLPSLEPAPAHDGTRTLGRLTLEGGSIPAERLLAQGAAAARLRRTLIDHAALALAAVSLGGATVIFDMTIEYLKTRRQFDRPIGSFQALKHRCASLRIRQKAAEASMLRAKEATGEAFELPSAAASIAKFQACDAFHAIAADSIQLHGGIGFTWENPCHLFLKRAKLNQVIFGNSASHQDRVAQLYLEAA
jgi:alkylation response protein AidB-like acyl-CoA dehydrogenase